MAVIFFSVTHLIMVLFIGAGMHAASDESPVPEMDLFRATTLITDSQTGIGGL